MPLPKNGRIVIVDDKYGEVKPLFNILGKQRIPFNYYSGARSELPNNPDENPLTILFLDLNIVVAQHTSKAVIATLHPILKAICPSKGAPYLLIIWSKRINEYAQDLKNHFNINKELKDRKPVKVVHLDKSDYFAYDDGEYVFQEQKYPNLLNEVDNQLTDLSLLKNLIEWENIVHEKASETKSEFTSFFPIDAEWDKNSKAVMYHLAKAVIGNDDINKKEIKTIAGNNVEVLKFNDEAKLAKAFLSINSFLSEKIENEIEAFKLGSITDIKDDAIAKRTPEGRLSSDIRAKINSKLHLVNKKSKDAILEQGNIYVFPYNKAIALKIISKEKYQGKTKQDILESKPQVVKLDITPVCDYSQNKGYIRKIYGLAIEHAFYSDIQASENYYYKTPILKINGKDTFILFDFRFIHTTSEKEISKLKSNPKYKLRREICTDIQSQLANQVNRPGISNL